MSTLDIIGFGALNVDKVYLVDNIAAKGEESYIIGYSESCGGSAANTITSLAKLGLSVGYLGKVAGDSEGHFLLDEFKEIQVDSTGIVISDNGRSGVVIAFVDRSGERALYVDPGVNDTLIWDEIKHEEASSAKVVHLTSFVGWQPLKAQIKLLKNLDDKVIVSLDPGEIYARKGLQILKPLLDRVNTLLLSKNEVELLTGLEFKKGAKTLMECGPEIVAVKLGSEGCYATDGEHSCHIDALKVKVVDTTGAGDAFNAGFLYGQLKGLPLKECMQLGSFTASKCITVIGARNGLPSKQEVNYFLEEICQHSK
jgi:ribokinase